MVVLEILGPARPDDGEIDILEGVHDNTHNQVTLHTATGCRVSSSNSTFLRMSGTVIDGNTDCAVPTTASRGCGIRADSPLTYGVGFNENGGGVYASTYAMITWQLLERKLMTDLLCTSVNICQT